MEKILTQPNEDARGEEIGRQVWMLIANTPREEGTQILCGILSSLVQQNLNMSEYLNNFVSTFNMFVTMAGAPMQMLTFPDWLETKDYTPEQRKEWINEKNLAFQKRQRKIKLLGEEG